MQKQVLIYGSSGALGRSLVSLFKAQNYLISAIDLNENLDCDTSYIVKAIEPSKVYDYISQKLGQSKFDTIINVAGGWAGGNLGDDGLLSNVELMFNQSVMSSVIAAKLGQSHLKENGLLVLTGAAAALNPTPGMIAYGMAKASVHHLVKSCGQESAGLPKGARAVGICPLDTPANRKYADANADFSTWTTLGDIGEKLISWSEGQECVSGRLYEIVTVAGKTEFILRK